MEDGRYTPHIKKKSLRVENKKSIAAKDDINAEWGNVLSLFGELKGWLSNCNKESELSSDFVERMKCNTPKATMASSSSRPESGLKTDSFERENNYTENINLTDCDSLIVNPITKLRMENKSVKAKSKIGTAPVNLNNLKTELFSDTDNNKKLLTPKLNQKYFVEGGVSPCTDDKGRTGLSAMGKENDPDLLSKNNIMEVNNTKDLITFLKDNKLNVNHNKLLTNSNMEKPENKWDHQLDYNGKRSNRGYESLQWLLQQRKLKDNTLSKSTHSVTRGKSESRESLIRKNSNSSHSIISKKGKVRKTKNTKIRKIAPGDSKSKNSASKDNRTKFQNQSKPSSSINFQKSLFKDPNKSKAEAKNYLANQYSLLRGDNDFLKCPSVSMDTIQSLYGENATERCSASKAQHDDNCCPENVQIVGTDGANLILKFNCKCMNTEPIYKIIKLEHKNTCQEISNREIQKKCDSAFTRNNMCLANDSIIEEPPEKETLNNNSSPSKAVNGNPAKGYKYTFDDPNYPRNPQISSNDKTSINLLKRSFNLSKKHTVLTCPKKLITFNECDQEVKNPNKRSKESLKYLKRRKKQNFNQLKPFYDYDNRDSSARSRNYFNPTINVQGEQKNSSSQGMIDGWTTAMNMQSEAVDFDEDLQNLPSQKRKRISFQNKLRKFTSQYQMQKCPSRGRMQMLAFHSKKRDFSSHCGIQKFPSQSRLQKNLHSQIVLPKNPPSQGKMKKIHSKGKTKKIYSQGRMHTEFPPTNIDFQSNLENIKGWQTMSPSMDIDKQKNFRKDVSSEMQAHIYPYDTKQTILPKTKVKFPPSFGNYANWQQNRPTSVEMPNSPFQTPASIQYRAKLQRLTPGAIVQMMDAQATVEDYGRESQNLPTSNKMETAPPSLGLNAQTSVKNSKKELHRNLRPSAKMESPPSSTGLNMQRTVEKNLEKVQNVSPSIKIGTMPPVPGSHIKLSTENSEKRHMLCASEKVQQDKTFNDMKPVDNYRKNIINKHLEGPINAEIIGNKSSSSLGAACEVKLNKLPNKYNVGEIKRLADAFISCQRLQSCLRKPVPLKCYKTIGSRPTRYPSTILNNDPNKAKKRSSKKSSHLSIIEPIIRPYQKRRSKSKIQKSGELITRSNSPMIQSERENRSSIVTFSSANNPKMKGNLIKSEGLNSKQRIKKRNSSSRKENLTSSNIIAKVIPHNKHVRMNSPKKSDDKPLLKNANYYSPFKKTLNEHTTNKQHFSPRNCDNREKDLQLGVNQEANKHFHQINFNCINRKSNKPNIAKTSKNSKPICKSKNRSKFFRLFLSKRKKQNPKNCMSQATEKTKNLNSSTKQNDVVPSINSDKKEQLCYQISCLYNKNLNLNIPTKVTHAKKVIKQKSPAVNCNSRMTNWKIVRVVNRKNNNLPRQRYTLKYKRKFASKRKSFKHSSLKFVTKTRIPGSIKSIDARKSNKNKISQFNKHQKLNRSRRSTEKSVKPVRDLITSKNMNLTKKKIIAKTNKLCRNGQKWKKTKKFCNNVFKNQRNFSLVMNNRSIASEFTSINKRQDPCSSKVYQNEQTVGIKHMCLEPKHSTNYLQNAQVYQNEQTVGIKHICMEPKHSTNYLQNAQVYQNEQTVGIKHKSLEPKHSTKYLQNAQVFMLVEETFPESHKENYSKNILKDSQIKFSDSNFISVENRCSSLIQNPKMKDIYCNHNMPDYYNTSKSSLSKTTIQKFVAIFHNLYVAIDDQLSSINLALTNMSRNKSNQSKMSNRLKMKIQSCNNNSRNSEIIYNQMFSVQKCCINSKRSPKSGDSWNEYANPNLKFKFDKNVVQLIHQELLYLQSQINLRTFQEVRDKIKNSETINERERDMILLDVDADLVKIRILKERINGLLEDLETKIAVQEELEILRRRLKDEFVSKFEFKTKKSKSEKRVKKCEGIVEKHVKLDENVIALAEDDLNFENISLRKKLEHVQDVLKHELHSIQKVLNSNHEYAIDYNIMSEEEAEDNESNTDEQLTMERQDSSNNRSLSMQTTTASASLHNSEDIKSDYYDAVTTIELTSNDNKPMVV